MVSNSTGIVVALSVLLSAPIGAQIGRSEPNRVVDTLRAGCPYVQCALSIAATWNGLAVVRGAGSERVANLHFFLPRPIQNSFAGDSARASAHRAFVTRRRGAVLTDLGGALLLAGAIGVVQRGELAGVPRVAALAGAALFAGSIPLQFAADGWLSRAVWWHNSAYAR